MTNEYECDDASDSDNNFQQQPVLERYDQARLVKMASRMVVNDR